MATRKREVALLATCYCSRRTMLDLERHSHQKFELQAGEVVPVGGFLRALPKAAEAPDEESMRRRWMT